MYAIASRPYLAETFEELIEASEVVLIGQVVSQRPEIRHDLVFTYSSVRVNQIVTGSLAEPAAMIDVLQTGGSANGMYTPALADEPLMHIGEAYLLCLTYAPEDGQYQAYYLPTGGGQGILPFTDIAQASHPTQSAASAELAGADTALAQVLARAEAVFAGRDYGCCEVMGGLYGEEISGGHWPKSSVSYDWDSTVTSIFGAYVGSAMVAWNKNDYITLTESPFGIQGDILVSSGIYGQSGWEAETSYNVGGTHYGTGKAYYGGIYQKVSIRVNSSKHELNDNIWVSILCHEGGHALGLGHVHPNDDSNSIMIPATDSRTASRPSSRDIDLVNSIYE